MSPHANYLNARTSALLPPDALQHEAEGPTSFQAPWYFLGADTVPSPRFARVGATSPKRQQRNDILHDNYNVAHFLTLARQQASRMPGTLGSRF